MSVPDKIERQMILNASRDTVWDSITKPELLAKWFVRSISVNELTVGQEFTFNWVNHDSSRAIVAALEPKTRFAYRWASHTADRSLPIAELPTTLVTFVLEDVDGGTRMTLTETGFAALPEPKVEFEENTNGWNTELVSLKKFVEAA